MGRLTRDPELRYTQQGIPVTEIGLAVNREYVVGTERRKETTFVDTTLWRRQAEVVCQYLKKGQPIFIEGKLTLDSWETSDGQKRTKLKVVADNFQFISQRSEGEAPQGDVPDESSYGGGGGGGSYGDEGAAPQAGGPGAGVSQGRRWAGSQGGRAPGAGSRQPSPPPQPSPSSDEGPLGVEEDTPF
jgi:single-strand DNA-binding protein